MTGPLQGIVIADFSQLVQGPFATQILADLGATVFKIEPINGDWLRSFALYDAYPGDESVSFLAFNRNKQSLAVNLKEPRGLEAARRITDTADVVVENFRPGVMDRLGLGYEELRRTNPGLVYCASSGYGQDGPYSSRPGQDLLVQALTGLPLLQGRATDPPVPVPIGIADLTAGLHIAYSVLAALIHRDRTGEGQRIDISLLNSLLALQSQELTAYLNTGQVPTRSRAGVGSPFTGAPFGIYKTSDGWLAIAMSPVARLAELLGVTGLEELESHNVFEGRDEIKERLESATATRTTAELLEQLLAADIWCAPVQDYADLTRDPQVAHNQMFATVQHPVAGEVVVVAPPVEFSATPPEIRTPPPVLGEHTRTILADVVGLTEAEIDSMLADQVVSQQSSVTAPNPEGSES